MQTFYVERLGPGGHPIAIVDVSFVGGFWEVNRINVPRAFRRQGIATRLLLRVLQDADAKGITLGLHPYGSGEMTTPELEKWYESHGFVYDTQRYYMFRSPRGNGK